MEFSKESDWARAQEIEEEQVKAMVERLVELKPDLVVTEKGVSDTCCSRGWACTDCVPSFAVLIQTAFLLLAVRTQTLAVSSLFVHRHLPVLLFCLFLEKVREGVRAEGRRVVDGRIGRPTPTLPPWIAGSWMNDRQLSVLGPRFVFDFGRGEAFCRPDALRSGAPAPAPSSSSPSPSSSSSFYLAQHVLVKHNISAIRRVRKTDNNRIALATGATIVNRIEDIREGDVGTKCGLFEVSKIGDGRGERESVPEADWANDDDPDRYFTFLVECTTPKACTILLRGPSKDILNEIDRNLADAMSVARNVVFNPWLVPGGGAVEMAISVGLHAKAKTLASGVEGGPFRAVADAMEVIPRTLVQNSGGNAMRVLTELRAKHANGEHTWGVNGDTGKIVDMKEYGLLESASVKIQTFKTAIEASRMLLRVDDVVQAVRKDREGGQAPNPEDIQPE
ncbi:hypothetical protein NMY22_g15319 [Coprinellus aureogranulatus]|nr:hypothetical protein NMY22_g15319 [Coprinellus aureogranulatus]